MKTTINDFRLTVPLESLERRLQCSYCGGSESTIVGKVDEVSAIKLVECLNCCLVSTNFFPTQQFLDNYYNLKFPDYVRKYNPNEESMVTFSKPQRFASRLNKLLPSKFINLEVVRILDFGGADGSLALEFANQLSNTTLIEITIVDFGQNHAKSIKKNISIKKFLHFLREKNMIS